MGNVQFEIPSWWVLGPLLTAFCVVLAVRVRSRRPGWYGKHAATRLTAALYATGTLHFVLFPMWMYFGVYGNEVPLWDQIQWVPVFGPDPSILANVVMTVPFGMMLPLLWRKASSLGRVTLWSALLSLSVEITQAILYAAVSYGRTIDATDLVANTLGGMIGYGILRLACRSRAVVGILSAYALPGSAFTPAGARDAVSSAPVA
ncbi:VanZ family protein [Streptomyces graminilatus]|uniref:VanZ family protein n=1 Tax=Streptomyces graminilatus TaxID=1464070 RepID=UPI0006E420E7|nr:VanZ family protein [Streptomyces graminilatus]